ncbi:MAG: hypothetical protein AB8H79_23580 [Myxococcota bacterium]
MRIDRIDPFEPMTPESDRYQQPPADGGGAMAQAVRQGLAPILWVGHAGMGKSTELVRAASLLQSSGPALRFDVGTIPGGVKPERVLYEVAVHTVHWWAQEGPDPLPSPFLVQDLRASDPSFPQGQGRTLPPHEIALAAWAELTGAAERDRVPLLIDGVDHLEPDCARAVLKALLVLEPYADLVVVGGPAQATGELNRAVVDRYRVVSLDPWDVERDAGYAAAVVQGYVGGDEPVAEPLVQRLVHASGGCMRDLLALTRDAAAYADETLDDAAIDKAIIDRVERFRRLVLSGDRQALREAHETSGLETPSDRKVRLLQHGLLMERGVGEAARVSVHPMAKRLMDVD